MHDLNDEPRALFLSARGPLYPESIICSGILPSQLEGHPCPYSDKGRMPYPQPLVEIETYARPQLGQLGDFAPPCAIEQLGHLKAWGENSGLEFPQALATLRIFKCRQMFLLVVPGLHHERAHEWTARS
jgi:hypothetical protein